MTVVFTDSFTITGGNLNIDAYPSGSPDYAYAEGSGTNLQVNAANDRVTIVAANAQVVAMITDAAVPTGGDQEITATTQAGAGGDSAFVTVRTNSPRNYYNSYIDTSAANEVKIYRRDASASTLLASVDRGLGNGTHTTRLKVTGTGATVSLEVQANATAVLTYDDTSGSRITTGPPGIGGYSFSGSTVYVDNVSVDNLGGAGTTIMRQMMQHHGG